MTSSESNVEVVEGETGISKSKCFGAKKSSDDEGKG